ncbi:polyadenylate-binding protein-like [Culex pipiens pallens]|uniref:polyadenylate-binding protein-like n=1 Tax=Culex pipiens pallens TaxID=42434 RepID=UPI0019537884|nr:polyadenylate-binding protein-like [Culex pipiens pallens]
MISPAGSGHRSNQTSLHVGNLSPNVTEAKLLEKFSAVGAVCSVRICRDRVTRRFLGYAYVSFRRAEDAARALETMKDRLFFGRPMRVTWAERTATQPGMPAEPRKDKRDVNKPVDNPVGIFITGLNAAIREKELERIFSPSGNIVECGVGLDDSGNSKGFGFVQFETEEAVENCLEKVKGWMLVGSTLAVTKLYTNIHVYNFGYRLYFEGFRALFEPYGTMIDYRVVKHNGKPRGFGYVTFEKLKSAALAIGELNGKDLGEGLKLKLESVPRPSSDGEGPPKHDQGVCLYIKIMEASVSSERLQDLFSPFGPLISVKVFAGVNGLGQRAGFVRFVSKEDATRAIAEMDGKVVGNGPLSVTFALVKDAKPPAVQPSKPKGSSKKERPTPDKVPAQTQSIEERRALTDRLYLVVRQLNASMAGSITAKLLELDSLPQLMTQPVALKAKLDETVVALLLNREQHLQQIESTPAGSAAA